jgi:hypothetical protein
VRHLRMWQRSGNCCAEKGHHRRKNRGTRDIVFGEVYRVPSQRQCLSVGTHSRLQNQDNKDAHVGYRGPKDLLFFLKRNDMGWVRAGFL